MKYHIEKKAAPTRNIIEVGPGDRARSEQSERDQWGGCHLELDEGEDAQQHGGGGQNRKGVRRSPGVCVGPDDGEDERPQSGRHGDGAADVQLGRPLPAPGSLGLGEVQERRRAGGDADGDIDEQDPAPRGFGREDATEEGTGRPARARHRAPGPQGLGQPDPRERGDDDGEGGGRQEGSTDALHGAGRGQPGRVLGQTPGQTGRGEDGQPEQVDAAAAEEIGGAAAQEQEPGERQHIGVDDPLQPGRAVAEVAPDGGQGHVDDRDVEHDHELRHTGDRQDDPVGDPAPVRCAQDAVFGTEGVRHEEICASLVIAVEPARTGNRDSKRWK